tara:strand:- start:156 stop:473 length:318 start_codon:yes stop_codon:yes gene_type:complete
MGKLLAVDANGLNILFSQNDISFINPHCQKRNSPKETKKSPVFSQTDASLSHAILLSGSCNSQFNFDFSTWETNFCEPIAIFNQHFSSRLLYLYLDNASPPPRLT